MYKLTKRGWGGGGGGRFWCNYIRSNIGAMHEVQSLVNAAVCLRYLR